MYNQRIEYVVIQKARLKGRDDFGRFLSSEGYKGIGVEIGTHRGDFAVTLLKTWACRKLYCIDPYFENYDDEDEVSGRDRTGDYEQAKRALRRRNGRGKLLKTTSVEAANRVEDGLDFVYVDGRHRYGDVLTDLKTWFPKLRRNGIIAGHDFVSPTREDGGWAKEVQPAVFDFLGIIGPRTLYLVLEPANKNWSFFLYKET